MDHDNKMTLIINLNSVKKPITFKSNEKLRDIKKPLETLFSLKPRRYKILYNNFDYTKFDRFTISELFLYSKTPEIKIDPIVTYYPPILLGYIEGSLNILVFCLKSQTLSMMKPINYIKLKSLPYNSRSCFYKAENLLFIIGGLEYEKQLILYDHSINCFDQLSDIPEAFSNHSAILYNEQIFCIGGTKALIYNISENSWSFLPDLNFERNDASLAIVNDNLIVFSGYSKTEISYHQHFEKIYLKGDLKKFDVFSIYFEKNVDWKACSHSLLLNIFEKNLSEKIIVLGGIRFGEGIKELFEFSFENLNMKKLTENNEFALKEAIAFTDNSFAIFEEIGYVFNFGFSLIVKFVLDKGVFVIKQEIDLSKEIEKLLKDFK